MSNERSAASTTTTATATATATATNGNVPNTAAASTNTNTNTNANTSSEAAASTVSQSSSTSNITVNAKSNERSAVVLALFGRSVGPCVGDFATTYNRVNGRLYAATKAILFYSNLFGFERRLCLRLSDIENIESFRSTSIRISMVDCEDHVFRKFIHRDEVLQILQALYQQQQQQQQQQNMRQEATTNTTPIRRISNIEERQLLVRRQTKEDGNYDGDDFSQQRNLLSYDAGSDSGTMHRRSRSKSVPSMHTMLVPATDSPATLRTPTTNKDISSRPRIFRRSNTTHVKFPATTLIPHTPPRDSPTTTTEDRTVKPIASTTTTAAAGANASQHSNGGKSSARPGQPTSFTLSTTIEDSATAPPAGFEMTKAWRQTKQPLPEVALEKTTLPCSLEAFMDTFCSNEAAFPIAKYQKDHIGDKQVLYGKWKKRPATYPPIFDREINFIHPLNNTVGPSQAKTVRQQRFQRFGSGGATLQNITTVQGVPAADCFRVEDRWIIERQSETSVTLTVTFQIVFLKRTMFKPIIQKNTKVETKKWFKGYSKFLVQALRRDRRESGGGGSDDMWATDSRSPSPLPLEESDSSLKIGKATSSLIPLPGSILVVLVSISVILAFALQLLNLQYSIQSVEVQIALMTAQNEELMVMVQHIISSKKC